MTVRILGISAFGMYPPLSASMMESAGSSKYKDSNGSSTSAHVSILKIIAKLLLKKASFNTKLKKMGSLV